MNENKRILWIDYYKAFAILLVVLGHTTTRFSGYIYQFHVAAFFFISGYVSKLEKKEFDQIVIQKFFNLVLPFIFYSVCGTLLFAFLQHYDVLQYVSSLGPIPSWKENIKNIFHVVYCDWLAGFWFLRTLFGCYVISKICLLLNKNKAGILYIVATLFIFKMGYYYHSTNTNPVFFDNLARYCIVQVFFSAGHLCRRLQEKKKMEIKNPVLVILLMMNLFVMVLLRRKGLRVDLAWTSINTPVIDLLMAGNGISFLICLSKLLEQIPFAKIKKGFEYIGKNTFGILLYHFFGFKLVSLLLCAFDVCDWTAIASLCPPQEISYTWWPLYLIGTIAFSSFIWYLTNKVKIIKFVSGNDTKAYTAIYDKYKAFLE